jgi:hypothetical protein
MRGMNHCSSRPALGVHAIVKMPFDGHQSAHDDVVHPFDDEIDLVALKPNGVLVSGAVTPR